MSGRHEYPDPTPVEVPLGFNRPPTLQEEIRRLVRVQLSRAAEEQGFETFEEADDFEVEEDPDPLTAYEVTEMQAEAVIGKETINGPPEAPPAAPPAAGAPPAAPPATPVASEAKPG